MLDIATFLACPINEVRTNSEHPQYRVRTINLASNIILESYLNILYLVANIEII